MWNCCHRVPSLTEDLRRLKIMDSELQSKSHFTCAQFYEEKIEAMRQLFSEVSYRYCEAVLCAQVHRRRALLVGSPLAGERDCVWMSVAMPCINRAMRTTDNRALLDRLNSDVLYAVKRPTRSSTLLPSRTRKSQAHAPLIVSPS